MLLCTCMCLYSVYMRGVEPVARMLARRGVELELIVRIMHAPHMSCVAADTVTAHYGEACLCSSFDQ